MRIKHHNYLAPRILWAAGIVREFSTGYDDIWVFCTRCLYSIALFAVAVHAQPPASSDLTKLVQSLNAAVRENNLTLAAEIAAKLNDGVQKRYRIWLIRDAKARVDEVLTWLPLDTESILVHQYPFTITNEAPEFLYSNRPSQYSVIERLAKLNDGRFYNALQGQTIRLVVADSANMRSRGDPRAFIRPPLSPEANAAWFYLFGEPVSLESVGAPDLTVGNQPAWRATAKLSVGSIRPGEREPSVGDDETWLMMARHDLLVMATSRELLEKIAYRIANKSKERALPGNLPEWQYVNRAAPVWGLRHYSSSAERNDDTNPRSQQIDKRYSDPTATGLAMQFDPDTHRVELDYLSSADHLPAIIDGPPYPQFRSEQSPGLWRLSADTTRKTYTILVAIGLLGFGGYR